MLFTRQRVSNAPIADMQRCFSSASSERRKIVRICSNAASPPLRTAMLYSGARKSAGILRGAFAGQEPRRVAQSAHGFAFSSSAKAATRLTASAETLASPPTLIICRPIERNSGVR